MTHFASCTLSASSGYSMRCARSWMSRESENLLYAELGLTRSTFVGLRQSLFDTARLGCSLTRTTSKPTVGFSGEFYIYGTSSTVSREELSGEFFRTPDSSWLQLYCVHALVARVLTTVGTQCALYGKVRLLYRK